MNTQFINATEYRNLPLSRSHRVHHQPSPHLRGERLEGVGRNHPQPGRSLSLAGAACHREQASRSSSERGVTALRRWPKSHTVPVRIKNLTDAEVLEAQLVENLIRRDVHPMEEAQGFRALAHLEEPKYSIEQIAAKTGKSPAYVAARSEVDRACAAVVEAFYREEIGVGHALLLAKLQPDQQEQALAACFKEDWSGAAQKASASFSPSAISSSGLSRMSCSS